MMKRTFSIFCIVMSTLLLFGLTVPPQQSVAAPNRMVSDPYPYPDSPLQTPEKIEVMLSNDSDITFTLPITVTNISTLPIQYKLHPFGSSPTPIISRTVEQPRLLVNSTDRLHHPPLVDRALDRLWIPPTILDHCGTIQFQIDLLYNGPWDLVIFSGEECGLGGDPPGALVEHLYNYLQAGGRFAFSTWALTGNRHSDLYEEMGFIEIGRVWGDAPPIYWWEEEHALFTYPEQVPPWLVRSNPPPGGASTLSGNYIEPLSSGIALAGYTNSPAPEQAAIVVSQSGHSIVKAIRDESTIADADNDGVLDGTELWENMISGLLYGYDVDVPWLTLSPISGTVPAGETVTIQLTFDPSAGELGRQTAVLRLFNDYPAGHIALPVTMTLCDHNCAWLPAIYHQATP